MMAGKGNPKGVGRPVGSVNKVTKDIREAIKAAFDQAGGVDYLVKQAKDNPTAFMTLVGKIVPAELKAEVAAKIIVESGVPR